jgi:hypothetical protein
MISVSETITLSGKIEEDLKTPGIEDQMQDFFDSRLLFSHSVKIASHIKFLRILLAI